MSTRAQVPLTELDWIRLKRLASLRRRSPARLAGELLAEALRRETATHPTSEIVQQERA